MTANKKIPVLRFKEFEGEWEEEKIGNCSIKVGSGSTPNGGEKVYTTSGIPFIRSQNIINNGLSLDNISCIPEEINDKMQGTIVKPLDILLNITGASIGRSCVVPTSFDRGNVNQHVCIIRLKSNHSPFFFQAYLSSMKGQNAIERSQVGSGREGLNFQSIRLLKIIVPKLSEQHKISIFLTAVDDKIQQLTKKKALLEQYKKGVMQQIFNQQIRFKDDDGKDYPDWVEKKLGEIGNIVSGLTYSPENVKQNGFLVLRSSNINERRLLFEDNVFVDVKDFNPVKENDILICVRNGSKNLIGKNALIKNSNEGLAFGAFMTVYRSDYNKFLFQWFDTNSYKKTVAANLGATINSINGSDLKKFKVPFPCIYEQRKISNFLTGIDNKIDLINQQLEKTKEFKKGLLQQMFV